MRLGAVRAECERGVVAGQGFVKAAKLAKQDASIVVRIGIARFQGNGAVKGGQRFGAVAEAAEGDGAVAVGGGDPVVQLDGTGNERGGWFGPARLQRKDAEEMPRVCIGWIVVEDVAV